VDVGGEVALRAHKGARMKKDVACPLCHGRSCRKVLSGIRDWEYGSEGSFSHWRCADCGVVHLEPFPDIELLQNAYDANYHGFLEPKNRGIAYQLLFGLNEQMLLWRLRTTVRRGARVLDVGCASGRFLTTLKQLGPTVAQGIDFSSVAVQLARARGVDARQGLFLDLASEELRYDVIFMNNYIEHTLDPASELALALQLLSPGGCLVGEIPSYRSLDRIFFGRFWGGNHAPRHTFQFTPESISSLLHRSGFSAVTVTQELNSGHWALSVQNYFRARYGNIRDRSVVRNGRAGYFQLLLLLFLPLNAVMALLGLSSVIRFRARPNDRR
jgi:SAM-dependent methyltransferase